LYDAYKIYCEEQGLVIVGKTRFSQRVAEQPGIREDRQQINDKTTRCWRGVALKDVTQKYLGIDIILGVCAYCGESKMLNSKDANGNCICDECRKEVLGSYGSN
jgi:phage/plasmid-associated DNA primase